MKNLHVKYDYTIHNISGEGTECYKAVIHGFDGIVFGSTLSELEEGVALAIEEEFAS